MNLNYLIVGIGVGAGIVAGVVIGRFIIAKHRNKQENINFEEYCLKCKTAANCEITSSEDIAKTILVIAKIDNNNIAPFIYRSYKNGRIIKKRIKFRSFPFLNCPDQVKEAIIKGEYILERY